MYKKTFLILSCFFLINCESSSYDLVIKNGQVFDGSGTESKTVDIAITGNTIIKVGKINSEKSTRVIDASGLIVSPGFIDTHAHLDPMDNFIKLSDSESHFMIGFSSCFVCVF